MPSLSVESPVHAFSPLLLAPPLWHSLAVQAEHMWKVVNFFEAFGAENGQLSGGGLQRLFTCLQGRGLIKPTHGGNERTLERFLQDVDLDFDGNVQASSSYFLLLSLASSLLLLRTSHSLHATQLPELVEYNCHSFDRIFTFFKDYL